MRLGGEARSEDCIACDDGEAATAEAAQLLVFSVFFPQRFGLLFEEIEPVLLVAATTISEESDVSGCGPASRSASTLSFSFFFAHRLFFPELVILVGTSGVGSDNLLSIRSGAPFTSPQRLFLFFDDSMSLDSRFPPCSTSFCDSTCCCRMSLISLIALPTSVLESARLAQSSCADPTSAPFSVGSAPT